MTMLWPNKSLQPTPVGRLGSAFAVDIAAPAWLSSRRSAALPLATTIRHHTSISHRPEIAMLGSSSIAFLHAIFPIPIP